MNQTQYYYADEQNQPVGPFTRDDLKKMISAGVIDSETQVCLEAGDYWISLDSLDSLASGSPSRPPLTPPPQKNTTTDKSDAKVEKSVGALAAASILFPVIAIVLNLIDASVPFMFLPGRSIGDLFIFFLIGLLGVLNARKLLKIPGIASRKPTAVKFAKTGIAIFALSVLLLILLAPGFGA